jgi:hypothetical protein
MAQDPRIQPLTDDLAILVRRENHSIAGATANRGDGGQLKALGVASARRARPHRGGLSAAGEIRDCPEGLSGMPQAACPVLALSGGSHDDDRTVAFGAKRTCREGGEGSDVERLTHLGHWVIKFAAMQKPKTTHRSGDLQRPLRALSPNMCVGEIGHFPCLPHTLLNLIFQSEHSSNSPTGINSEGHCRANSSDARIVRWSFAVSVSMRAARFIAGPTQVNFRRFRLTR